MTIFNPEGMHEKYTQTTRHWSPRSEKYTGADSLLTAQREGWRIVGLAYRQAISLSGGRQTTIYHFKLIRDEETRLMPVTANPFVMRLIKLHRIAVIRYRYQDEKYSEQAPIEAIEEERDEVFV